MDWHKPMHTLRVHIDITFDAMKVGEKLTERRKATVSVEVSLARESDAHFRQHSCSISINFSSEI